MRENHLGGFWPGGDPSSWYPELWRWLVREQGVRSVVDVGCGEGHALGFFRELGCDVLGIDGVEFEDERTFVHDYTTGPLNLGARYDLCWTCEFVEHVAEEYVPNFLPTFRAADLLLMTAAIPGQRGHHHVNLHTPDYWRELIESSGFELDLHLTAVTRRLSLENEAFDNYYARTGMAFRRRP